MTDLGIASFMHIPTVQFITETARGMLPTRRAHSTCCLPRLLAVQLGKVNEPNEEASNFSEHSLAEKDRDYEALIEDKRAKDGMLNVLDPILKTIAADYVDQVRYSPCALA